MLINALKMLLLFTNRQGATHRKSYRNLRVVFSDDLDRYNRRSSVPLENIIVCYLALFPQQHFTPRCCK
jgi:hypothetical protein